MDSDSTIILPKKELYIPQKEEIIVVVFNGQGAWFPGMGKDLCELPLGREMYEKASYFASIAIDREITVADLQMEGPRDSCMQLLATYVYGVTLTELRKQIEEEDRVYCRGDITVRITDAKIKAGHSAGELAALTGEAFGFQQGSTLVARRGKYLVENPDLEFEDTCMISVKIASKDDLEKMCKDTGTYIALENSETAYVVGGIPENIKALQGEIRKRKGKTRPIKMSVAPHTPLYEKPAKKFGELLRAASRLFKRPQTIVMSNATGMPYEEDIVTPLEMQLTNRVKFVAIAKYVLAQNPVIVEVGPGNAASKFLRDTDPKVKIVALRNAADLYNSALEPNKRAA